MKTRRLPSPALTSNPGPDRTFRRLAPGADRRWREPAPAQMGRPGAPRAALGHLARLHARLELLVPDAQRLALNTRPEHGGGNVALLKQLPQGGRVAICGTGWIHAHYLVPRQPGLGGQARVAAAGADAILDLGWQHPRHANQSTAYRWLTRKGAQGLRGDHVGLAAHGRQDARAGRGEVMVFPAGLRPCRANRGEDPGSSFSNRGLEPALPPGWCWRCLRALPRSARPRLVITPMTARCAPG